MGLFVGAYLKKRGRWPQGLQAQMTRALSRRPVEHMAWLHTDRCQVVYAHRLWAAQLQQHTDSPLSGSPHRTLAQEGNSTLGGGRRITPRLRRSALRAAAPCAAFSGAFAPASNLCSVRILPAVAREGNSTLVEGGGFEPPKAEPSDLQSDPFDRSGTPPKKRRYSVGTAVCCQLSELTAKSGRRSSDTKTRVVAFRARMAGSGIYAACR